MIEMVTRVESEADSFRSFVTPHLAALRRFASVLVRPADVDDLVQDTLARAWVKHATFDPDRGAPVSWMMAIMADRARKQWRAATPLLGLAERDSPVAEPDTATIDLRRAVDALPTRQRTAIVLHHYLDLPIAETARYMKCSSGTVKSTLSDARKSLAKRLGEPYARP